MRQQRAALSEAFTAGVADERPLLTMDGAVNLQVSGLGEAAAAHVTAECPQTRVNELVAAQVGRQAEALPTGVAAEGLLTGVDALVNHQAAPAGEADPALLARVRPLTCMRSQVSSEAALLTEGCVADAAGEWSQASVDGQLVHVDAVACGESLFAYGTGERFVCQVNPAVRRQVAAFGELLPALATADLLCFVTRLSETTTRRAPLTQCLEVTAGLKPLSTVRTAVGAAAPVCGELVLRDAALG